MRSYRFPGFLVLPRQPAKSNPGFASLAFALVISLSAMTPGPDSPKPPQYPTAPPEAATEAPPAEDAGWSSTTLVLAGVAGLVLLLLAGRALRPRRAGPPDRMGPLHRTM